MENNLSLLGKEKKSQNSLGSNKETIRPGPRMIVKATHGAGSSSVEVTVPCSACPPPSDPKGSPLASEQAALPADIHLPVLLSAHIWGRTTREREAD